MEHTVLHDEGVCRFEVIEFNLIAYLQYKESDGVIDILHINVPPALEGHGVASQLVKEVVAYAIKNNLKIKPTCPFAKTFFKRHVDYKGFLV